MQKAPTYDALSTMREARKMYFEAYGFGDDGGYDDAWVNIKLGPLPVSFPNTKERVRAVRYHDLHHVLTGYAADNVGEFEISAWEIAGGCKDFWVAWFLNLSGVAGGLIRSPTRTLRAFARGRKSGTLYGRDFEPLLEQRLSDLRQSMGLDEPVRITAWDLVLCLGAGFVGLALGTVFLVLGVISAPIVLTWLSAKKSKAAPST